MPIEGPPIIGDGLIPREGNGGIPINIQDQTTRMLDLFFVQATGVLTTVAVEVVTDTYEITLTDTTGFVDGACVGMFSPTGDYHFACQLGAPVGNTITLDTSSGFNFPVGSYVRTFVRNMAVDGSTTRQIYTVGPVGMGAPIEIDITRVHGVITDNLDMDDSKFGGIAALTRGCVLRKNNGELLNYANFKSNGCIAIYSGEPINYTDKAGAGEYSAAFKVPFSGPENHGVTIRLEPGDVLEMIIQDDLTGLSSFRMMAQGHFVTS